MNGISRSVSSLPIARKYGNHSKNMKCKPNMGTKMRIDLAKRLFLFFILFWLKFFKLMNLN